ncbi:uncharacterized protein JN550_009331 [Neoarthrinium moseri]|uniref:uncharacterized protein n=1 Tax=Neoarthrinium moseri TaxID=1658444 RepID=UPI001FDC7F1F|nr:uncharacterized protein JN550_009331 [Neoarthrinium moseri]KAI1863833.1 hypothetical protein JN550_009331 [Neoarthrinium moseri]
MEEEQQVELLHQLDNALQARLRPREEAVMVRKLMAAQLAQSVGSDQLQHPLALIDYDAKVTESAELRGRQGDFVEAVKRGVDEYKRFASLLAQQQDLADQAQQQKQREDELKENDSQILDLHLEVARLQKRYDRLQVVRKTLDELQKQPAGAPDFLDPDIMYKDCAPLPEMPKEMVEGFATDHSGTDTEAEALLQNLKKTVLRSKLIAQREQRQYDREQAQNPFDPSTLPPPAKLHALNAVKNTLISWIETQLSKAGDDGADSEVEDTERPSASKVQYDHDAVMEDIQAKYQTHLALRKQILGLLAQAEQIKAPKVHEAKPRPKSQNAPVSKPEPSAYLLTPYIEQLQALSREQKSTIQEKSHINASLGKQREHTQQALDHLTQESQLLPRYPVAKEPSKSSTSFDQATRSSSRIDIMRQIQPWIYAADSAKIATLETVAEKVEEGMMSIEESRQNLEEVCKLFNINLQEFVGKEGENRGTEGDVEHDLVSPRKGHEKKKSEVEPPKTVWDILDGNLGSINE